MNRPNCEIIRGEVSIFRGGAGGLSYFSSGSFRGTLRVGANWPGAVASPDSKSKQIKKRVLDTIKHLNSKKGDRISEHTRGVHQIFSTQTGHGRPDNGSAGIVLSNDQRKVELVFPNFLFQFGSHTTETGTWELLEFIL